jgi:hypothetical protein
LGDLAALRWRHSFGAGFAAALSAQATKRHGMRVLLPLDRLFFGFLANGKVYNSFGELTYGKPGVKNDGFLAWGRRI